jgi:phospholipid/cholesterol/gamma-HCH transport system substrate-binding protein
MRRPRIKPLKDRNPVAVGIVGLLLSALVALIAYNADALPVIGGGTGYTAEFSEAAGLREGDEVRVAGVKVGSVTGISLDGDRVLVGFRVKDAWIGDASTVAIAIKTLLGSKYLALDPLGTGAQDPGERIPLARTTSPLDVTKAFEGLGDTLGELDTEKIAESFQVISETFRDTPPEVSAALQGLSDLSRTVSSRDTEIAELLAAGEQISGALAGQNGNIEALISDGNLLLAEIGERRTAIHALLTGSQELGRELAGVVEDNNEQIGPTLDALDRVTGVLEENQQQLDQALALAGPYYRLMGNALGTGRWFDSYICGVVPPEYLPDGARPKTGCAPPDTRGSDTSGSNPGGGS